MLTVKLMLNHMQPFLHTHHAFYNLRKFSKNMRELTASSQSWTVLNEKQKMQHNFSIDLAEHFHHLIANA